ncbi:MAG: GNAT family N-acetyltransferase [Trueperaceae bacterium]|nr:GNAT family N-acetyltransferase [Trueperaceae bacterium]
MKISAYRTEDAIHIRQILTDVGWDERYIKAFEQAAEHLSQESHSAVYLAQLSNETAGFIFVEYRTWNRLAQIQGLAVAPSFFRKGVASELVKKVEDFARSQQARGIYVDTPINNDRGRRFYESIGYKLGYLMPQYYDDGLDGVTYQKFFY